MLPGKKEKNPELGTIQNCSPQRKKKKCRPHFAKLLQPDARLMSRIMLRQKAKESTGRIPT